MPTTATPPRQPTIGITCDSLVRTDRPDVFAVSSAYADCIRAAGGVPVLIAPMPLAESGKLVKPDTPEQLVHLDGVVIIGGDDPDPELQGFHRTPWTKPMSRRRELTDRWLIRRCRELRIPLLAIGAGCQLLNVVCLGTLHYHIPEDLPKALPHCSPDGAILRHPIYFDLESDSIMRRVFDCATSKTKGKKGTTHDRETVTSRHHQAIDEVGGGFKATAWAGDRVVEAIESTDPDWLAVGVQFHPEAPQATAIERQVFEVWVEGILGKGDSVPRDIIPITDLSAPAPPAPPAVASQLDYLIDRNEAACRIGITYDRLAIIDSHGTGPKNRRMIGGKVWYRVEDIDEYIRHRKTIRHKRRSKRTPADNRAQYLQFDNPPELASSAISATTT